MDMNMPISLDWTKDEVVDVLDFYQAVEDVFSRGMERDKFLNYYKRFKEIVPSKSEEKQLCQQFDEQAEVSCYHAVKTAKEKQTGEMIRLTK
ncbi:hypothetical protein AJ85_09205 [Alkalihalobacillus alcalophilus ATCC 27647 = CGMCC 1.3604]|uniref:Uncharacterized protein n=1 Tax=Alkalihalobacillus alcalophilus ATCC 27647 = CGMCC 1.3604 TaxID=1218173 RepID=A0A094YZ76_ALKAL|nr:UPF0223 family protein [Alkalihalobacillus alcalophilus]KGA98852.1 hypothetical protein BALCAV_0201895 [Alkalihalobacillus alcalophilus ATCC 27647 = CGMCC 1.3604]MED1564262.1 UPF0223 family protein [Alkalihalobacillus alcalophilus]THG90738.1 hypothetical protein AJ85_09205 [Alkalihalobacillus alcalophilus ATCC 27647 = CGMCC 1.3604]